MNSTNTCLERLHIMFPVGQIGSNLTNGFFVSIGQIDLTAGDDLVKVQSGTEQVCNLYLLFLLNSYSKSD